MGSLLRVKFGQLLISEISDPKVAELMALTGASQEDASSYLLMAPEGTVESAAALYLSHQPAGSATETPEDNSADTRVDELAALTGASREIAQSYLLMSPEGTVESAAGRFFSHNEGSTMQVGDDSGL